jgi:hypothetical protein
MRRVLYGLGLVSIGAGLGVGGFSAMALKEAINLEKKSEDYESLAKQLHDDPTIPAFEYEGMTLGESGWHRKAVDTQLQALPKGIVGYQLLATSIGLALGGVALCFWGWGLRPAVEVYRTS